MRRRILLRPLLITDDRQRATTSRWVWRPLGGGLYGLSLLGIINGVRDTFDLPRVQL